MSNLFPPHHGGTFDHHCQAVVESLKLRGHTVRVLTSSHGLRTEQRDLEVERRLQLNGILGHPEVTGVMELKPIEMHNNSVLKETLEEFQPEVVHVFSLDGLSKSMVFTLYNSRRPVVYDVFDYWLTSDIARDPWLRFWNASSLSFLDQSKRKALEVSGERLRLDATAPTRLMRGYDRVPGLFGNEKERATVAPNSLAGFRFDRIYFCSQTLKQLTEQAGFCVNHGEVIHPFITAAYVGEVASASHPIKKFLIVEELNRASGVLTALKALKIVRDARIDIRLSIYGRGDSSYMAELRSFVVSNQLPVEFLTVSNQNSDLHSVYKKHDALLHTPEWAEPFPFTAMEAMGCGLPVIGARSGGMEELLRHGENALTYPAGNERELAARIQEMLISPALRVQMAELAQQDVLSKMNDTNVIDQIENFLAVSQAQTT